MNDTKFQDSRRSLALSQSLVDRMHAKAPVQENKAQPSPEMAPAPAAPAPSTPPPQTPASQGQPQEAGLLSSFMDEVRALFKGKEDEEKKTQGLVEQHNKDMEDIKKGISEIIDEERK